MSTFSFNNCKHFSL